MRRINEIGPDPQSGPRAHATPGKCFPVAFRKFSRRCAVAEAGRGVSACIELDRQQRFVRTADRLDVNYRVAGNEDVFRVHALGQQIAARLFGRRKMQIREVSREPAVNFFRERVARGCAGPFSMWPTFTLL